MVHKKLGEILIEKRLVTEIQLKECLQEQHLTREYLGAILMKKKFVTEEELMKAISEQYGIPYISMKTLYIDWDIVQRFSSVIMTDQKVFPFRQEETTIVTAVSDPLDAMAISRLEEEAKPKNLRLVLVSPQELKECVQECRRRSRGALKHLLEEDADAQ